MKKIFFILIALYSLATNANAEANTSFIQAVKEFRHEIRINKELRSLIKQARSKKHFDERALVTEKLRDFFADRGIFFGYIKTSKMINTHFLLWRNSKDDLQNGSYNDSHTDGIGPGIGLSSGYQITACTLGHESKMIEGYGASATAIIGVGITVGAYLTNGLICVRVGAGYGFDVGVALEKIKSY